MAILALFLLLSILPSPAYAGDTRQITVVYLFDESCHQCAEAMPVVRQAVREAGTEGLAVDYREILVDSREGLSYVDRYRLTDIPVLIIDNHTIIGPVILNGDYDSALRDTKDAIKSSCGYAPPVTVHTTAVKKSDDDSSVTITVYMSNQGNGTVNASLTGGLTEGSRLSSGQFFWSGTLLPGAEEKITYVLSGGNTSHVSPSIVYYEDSRGSHFVAGREEPVTIVPVLSVPFAFAYGLIAAFNPCILAIVAYMATLAASEGKRRTLLTGIIAFCAGLLCTYSIIGICFYLIGVAVPSAYALARYAIVAAILVIGSSAIIKAIYPDKRGLSDAGLKRLVALLQPYGNMSISGFSFAMGAGFGLIKMPCAGGPYLAILGMMAEHATSFRGLSLLLAYDTGVVMPVLGLGVLLAVGLTGTQLDAIRARYRAALNMATGIALLMLAIMISFDLV